MNPIVLNINALIEETASLLERLIGEDVEVRLCLAPDLGSARVDPGEIKQVLINLATNARDATPRGGTLTIETANVVLDAEYAARHAGVKPGPYILLAVTDSGCGMDEDTRRHIFDPFFTTKETGKGTGLGLATAYAIVKQHDGNIRAYSEPGKGTTINVYLPCVDAIPVPSGRKASDEPALGGSEGILVVEDDATVRELARRTLEGMGYTVLTAASADEAEAVFAQDHGEKIALLLTDVVLPTCDGGELHERLARGHPRLKVLYMSGYANHAVFNRRMLRQGAAFLQKPFPPEALARKVREVLDGRAAVAAEPA